MSSGFDEFPPGAIPDDARAGSEGTREIVLVTGISGSGKSIALHALEDAGFFCVDNLPPELLPEFLRLEIERSIRRVAVAVDVRTAGSLPRLVPLLESLRNEGVKVRPVFLDASTDTLVRRYSETRRPHPLSKGHHDTDTHRALIEAIELERELLADIRVRSTILDTSQLRPVQLRRWVRDLVGAPGGAPTPASCRSSSNRSRSSAACRWTPTWSTTCACCPIRTICASCARSPAATSTSPTTCAGSPR
jgi:UPF0042 nucleotide-binding protein